MTRMNAPGVLACDLGDMLIPAILARSGQARRGASGVCRDVPVHIATGFTLLEVAVALSVIALLIAGILVGRDLVRASKVRAQLTQLESFTQAVSTFRDKYAGIPGDLRASDAAALGFVARSGAVGHGDGNSLIEGCEAFDPFGTNVPLGCEVVLFWSDLSDAGLVAESFPSAEDDYVSIARYEDSLGYFPKAALADRGTVIPVRCIRAGLYYRLLRLSTATSYGPAIYAADAQSMDRKIDDGVPGSGAMQIKNIGYGSSEEFFCQPMTVSSCVTSSGSYSVTVVSAPVCSPLVKVPGL